MIGRLLFSIAVWGLLGIHAASAQSYPTRTITIINSAPPGGVQDNLARLLAQHFTEAWGQSAVVESRAGANNQVGASYVTNAKPDGYTLFVSPEVTFVVNPSVYSKLQYDPVGGFTPISGLIGLNHALVTNPRVNVSSVQDLIELGKKTPDKLNYATFGAGSSSHLNFELFQAMTGTKFRAVHYKGAAPAMVDVVGGHVEMMFANFGTAMNQLKDNKIRVLGVAAKQRIPLAPDIPTIAESGVPGFESVSWFGLWGPAGMPKEIVTKISEEVQRIFAKPEVREKYLQPQYFESYAGTPQQLEERLAADRKKWSKIIADAGIKLD